MLRRRFLLALLPLPLLFLGVGIYAVYLLSSLSQAIDEIVNPTLPSIMAADGLQAAGLKMESAVTLAFNLQDEKAADAFQSGATNFQRGLDVLMKNPSVPGDEVLVRKIQSVYHEMGLAWASLLAADPPNRSSPRDRFEGLNQKAGLLADEIRALNLQAISTRKAEAHYACQNSIRLLGMAMIAATIIWAFVAARLAHTVLRPVRALTRSLQRLGADQTASPLGVLSEDELGTLIEEFNDMSARLETYRNSTQASAVRAQKILRTTLAVFPDPVFVLTPELGIELQNTAADRLTSSLNTNGVLPEPLVSRAQQVMAAARDYRPRRFQDSLKFRIEDEERYFLPKIVAMRDDKDGLVGVAVVLEDVTQFRFLDELKTNLLSTVSHEIKTPLTSIRMSIHLLQEQSVGPLRPKQAALLKTAREDVERLLRLLNNLLEMARFEHGAPRMHWETVPVRNLIGEAVAEVATLSAVRQLKIKADCEMDLPDLHVDRARISDVLRNLLTNAIKHSPEGGEILVTARRAENGGVHFTIQDQGRGISEEHQAHIFEKFYRVPGQKIQGSGLGLSIARDIILAHFGTIGCKSMPGAQTTFYFTLPDAAEQERRLASASG
jgi:two-component system, NtrC family, sensor histidine kinase KinB